MGKINPQTANRSCSGHIPRYIAHRVGMHSQHSKRGVNGFIPLMTKQSLETLGTGRYTDMLKWRTIPEVLHNEAQRKKGTCVGTSCHGTINFYESPPGTCHSTRVYTAPGQVTNEKCKQQIINAAAAASAPGGQMCCTAMGYPNIATEVRNIGCAGMPSTIKCP